MNRKSMTMLAVGDIALQEPKGEFFLSLVAPILKSGDVVTGQAEIVYTSRGFNTFAGMFHPTPPCPPENMGALAAAGFNVITLAGNHTWDMGAPGIEDTITGLRKYDVTVIGAGMNIDEARKPAIIERNGTRFGFLDYNCVGPMLSWATPEKPGCAYIHIIAHYEINIASPGGPPDVYTFAEPSSLEAMVEDIHKLRPLCDILVAVIHKGVIGTQDRLAMYEQQVSHTAIDAGADVVLGHHAHRIKGIEQYKGKPIFHNLGDFVPAYLAETEEQKSKHLNLAAYSMFTPQPDLARNWCMIAKCTIIDREISQVGFLPCLVNDKKQPEVLKNDNRAQQLFDFMNKITKIEKLNTQYEWKDEEIVAIFP